MPLGLHAHRLCHAEPWMGELRRTRGARRSRDRRQVGSRPCTRRPSVPRHASL